MAALLLARSAIRRHAVPLTLSVSSAAFMATRQKPMRLDARPAPPSKAVVESDEWLDPQVIKQVSGGSLSGFLTGLLVSMFSRTLVVLAGVAIVAIQVASRYGINLVEMLKLRKRIESSKILSALNRNTSFKLAFGITFALSAFFQF